MLCTHFSFPIGYAFDSGHDVSNEPRDSDGQWTTGGGTARKTSAQTWDDRSEPKTESPEHVARAKSLRLPPAWKNVRLSKDINSALQATGEDSKGRIQYRYSTEHSEKQAAAKFSRVREFVGELPSIREKYLNGLKEGKPEAAVLYLIDKTGMRVGSDRDTKAKEQAYGVTTLQSRHVTVNGDEVAFDFVGKKGVRIQQRVKDAKLAEIIAARKRRGADRLFDTDDGRVRDYLHSIDGPFKVKDFRTAVAAAEALKIIKKIEDPKDEKDFRKKQMEVAKVVSAKLGNTPAMALKAYIPPEVFAKWQSKIQM